MLLRSGIINYISKLANTFYIKPSVTKLLADIPSLGGRSLFFAAVDEAWEGGEL